MNTIILTSFKEPETIKIALERILDKEFGNRLPNTEILAVIPDEATINAAKETFDKFKFDNWKIVKDLMMGKPSALNLAFKEARGDIWIFTDGDVYLEKDALTELLSVFKENKDIGGVSGQPVNREPKKTLFGYWGHLLSSTMNKGRTQANKKGSPYLMSGYLMATRKLDFEIPDGVLDDAYITYKLAEHGYKIRYAPKARVVVTYPKGINDFINQKVRNLVGFKYSVRGIQIKGISKQRSFASELKNFFLPLQYATSFRELIFSLFLYPVRLFIWIKAFYIARYKKPHIIKLWKRVESTK